MRKVNGLIILFLLSWLAVIGREIQAISITVTGSWSETIDESDLQAGPGSDLRAKYTSAKDQISIDIGDTAANWEVNVSKFDTNWHPDFQLSVKRTSKGTGPGSIKGGNSGQQVTDVSQQFFYGSETRDNVEVQFKLDGVSVQIPPDTYLTTVYYEVVEI